MSVLHRPDPVPDQLWQLAVWLDEFQAKHDAEIAALHAEIAELRKNAALPEADLDGQPRPAGNWKRIKQAAAATGRSESGIRKLRDQGKIGSWRRVWINADTVPRKVRSAE